MRNLSSQTEAPSAGPPPIAGEPSATRTTGDFTSLLLELARAERGFRFYGEGDSRRRPLANRAVRAVSSELERAGALEFTIRADGFRLVGSNRHVAASGALVELERALEVHGVERIRLDTSLTTTALVGFLDLLSQSATPRDDPAEHFARALAARDTRGIRINRIASPRQDPTPKLTDTPPRVSPSLASRTTEDATPGPRPTESARAPASQSLLDERPLEAVASDDRGERLRARLIELDATVDDEPYCARVSDVVVWAEDLWREELIDECYRAELVLADHAVGSGGRTEVQARAASASFAKLASGPRLADLIRRARDAARPGIRAAQLLLQLGGAAVPAILNELCRETDPARIAPLRALILTQGEAALPHLVEAISGHDATRARVGIRLAGELQNAAILPTLVSALRSPELTRRLETIRALSLLPGDEAKRALADALERDLDEITNAAGPALASRGALDVVPALLDVVETTLHSSRTQLGRRLIELLGRIGDERAVPRLCSILERRPVLRRAHWHAIQLVAVDALGKLPTKQARRAVERAARQAPRAVRERARTTLESLERGA